MAPTLAVGVAAARAVAARLGLRVDDVVVLQAANRLVVRLTGCDVVARVAEGPHRDGAAFELDVARRLVDAGCEVVAEPHPGCEQRVHDEGGVGVTLWTWYEPAGGDVAPTAYAHALTELHAAMRSVEADVVTPHLVDRVDDALRIVDDAGASPELRDGDRSFLAAALRDLRDSVLRRAEVQVVHGEPHPGNVLATAHGPRVIDLETCCRAPVAFDLAHAPEEVADRYGGADPELLRDCRNLARALVTAWRWDRDDVFPGGRAMGVDWLAALRAGMGG